MTNTFGQALAANLKDGITRKSLILTILGLVAFPFLMAGVISSLGTPEWGIGNPFIEELYTYGGSLQMWAIVTPTCVAIYTIFVLAMASGEIIVERRRDRKTTLAGAAI